MLRPTITREPGTREPWVVEWPAGGKCAPNRRRFYTWCAAQHFARPMATALRMDNPMGVVIPMPPPRGQRQAA